MGTMNNPTYYAACLEKLESERNARVQLAVINSKLATIRKFRRSKASKAIDKLLRECAAL